MELYRLFAFEAFFFFFLQNGFKLNSINWIIKLLRLIEKIYISKY